MSTPPGLLKVSPEIRDQIYQHIVATDQPTQKLLRSEEVKEHFTTTTSSLGLLSTCYQLRAEFLNFFVDHRQHVFKDPLVFANEFLIMIGNARRIQTLRHVSLTWPIEKDVCAQIPCVSVAKHRHAAVPSHVTVGGHMRSLNTVMHTYPELIQSIETMKFSFPLPRRLNPVSLSCEVDAFEGVLYLLNTVDTISRKLTLPRRYFFIQTDTAGFNFDKTPTEIMVWAVTKDMWDKISDGAYVQDRTCPTCRLSDTSGWEWWRNRHSQFFVRPGNCEEDNRDMWPRDIYVRYDLDQVEDKNWKVMFHGRDGNSGRYWCEVLRKYAAEKSRKENRAGKRKRSEKS